MRQSAGGRLPWPRAVEWGIAICEVLTYLHGHLPPFVFRDLKPANMILDERTNRPVLIDFGLSRRLTATAGTAAGADGYMPYEQAAGTPSRAATYMRWAPRCTRWSRGSAPTSSTRA